jgi:hypothetical protein
MTTFCGCSSTDLHEWLVRRAAAREVISEASIVAGTELIVT